MFKKGLKLFFHLLFFCIMLFSIIRYELVIYGISQGKGQLSLIMNAEPVADVVKDPAFPDSLKQKLTLISEIREFAFDSLGINRNNNYTTVYNQNKQSVLWTISASEPYALKPKEWTFPFLGSVPYKGFFNRTALRKEYLELVAQGYDIDVYSPSGWSTLGWFNDPILTNMLYRDEGSLANLIIHELTHGTLYVKDSATFNENLANFIGDKGAQQFMRSKYGPGSKQALNYEEDKADTKIYDDYILKSIPRLDSLYQQLGRGLSEEEIKKEKQKLITAIALGVNKLPLHKKKNYFRYTLQALREGNAFFMAFSRYDSQYDIFEKEFKEKYHSDLKEYLKGLKKIYPSL